MMTVVVRAVCVVLVALAGLRPGCAPGDAGAGRERDEAQRGSLVIVGGGLEDDRAEVFQALLTRAASGPIGIVPTASGGGLETGASAAERFARHAGGREIVVIPLTQHDADKANDPRMAELIGSCGALWFTGGDQSRIVRVFRPEPARESAVFAACQALLARGGVIGGTSAGAAMMSDPMITGGRARRGAAADTENPTPADAGVRLGVGMGFLSSGITDQHFLERARMGRLIEAMRATNAPFGYGVSENCAMVVDRNSGDFEAIGELGVVMLTRDAQARGGEVRLSIFSTGDRGHVRGASCVPGPGLSQVRSDGPGVDLGSCEDVFGRESVEHVVRALERGAASARTSDEWRVLEVRVDDRRSRVFRSAGGERPGLVIDAILDVRERGS